MARINVGFNGDITLAIQHAEKNSVAERDYATGMARLSRKHKLAAKRWTRRAQQLRAKRARDVCSC